MGLEKLLRITLEKSDSAESRNKEVVISGFLQRTFFRFLCRSSNIQIASQTEMAVGSTFPQVNLQG
jgi:hypothetical protein